MNDMEFGRIALFLCRTDGVESEAVGTILWLIWDDFGDKKTGEWKQDE